MRLLQLATAPDRLIDLHPNVTVVSGLDDAGRRLLADAILALARGAAPGPKGLLEAHGVLFDLSDDMLRLLEVSADGLRPVVTASELPTIRHDPRARERSNAERALGELEERWVSAGEEHRRLQISRDAAAEALELARRNANETEASAAERIRLIDELTAQLDQAGERRRQLIEEQLDRGPKAERAVNNLAEVGAATIDVRSRHQETAIRCSELAGQLDQARLGLDPGALADAEAAGDALARIEVEIEAERAAQAERMGPEPVDEEPAVDRLARVQSRIEELEKGLAAFAPIEAFQVANALEHLRARQDGELIPSPAALALADQLSEVEADLAATAGVGATSGGLAAGRARLDDARHALLEAEQAVRNPELDRDVVDRLEMAHAELLESLDKADGRFSGARAERRVEAARTAEQELLDELGFASYSDYMMGYSLLNIDPAKEETLDAARAELSAAEDAWHVLQAETDAELARAERMERRRLLLDEARTLLDRPVAAATAVDELRALREQARLPPELVEDLQRSLDDAGVAVSGEDLNLDELMLLAEAWLDEAHHASAREQELRAELVGLADERAEAVAAVEAEAARTAQSDGPSAEDERQARLTAAQARLEASDARRRMHLEAEELVTSITRALADAAEAERVAAEAAADAEAAVAEATERAERHAGRLEQIAVELADLDQADAEANEHLQSLTEHESASAEDLALELAVTATGFEAADHRFQEASAALEELARQRQEAQFYLDSFQDVADPAEEGSIAEEIEWYLLARLAAQRSVCLGGSLPLLLDDALSELDEDQLGHVLGRLERMADAVQVIVISDDPLAASWALTAGQDRAAVVTPEPA